MTESLPAAVAAERGCLCGHSKAAHQFISTGKCSFCECPRFDLHSVSGEVRPIEPPLSGLASDAGYILLREMAERLGIAAAQLRRAAEKRMVPAVKVAKRWAVRPEDVPLIEAHFASRTASQRAQATSFHDLTAHLRHTGRVVSGAVIGDQPPISPARRAETQAIDHQMDPTAPDPRPPLTAEDVHGDSKAAEQDALEDFLGPNPTPAPERSLEASAPRRALGQAPASNTPKDRPH